MKINNLNRGHNAIKTLIISAGGTGGHIFPALAVAAQLEGKYNLVWVGGKTGLENKLVPEHGYPLARVTVAGVRNKGLLRKLFLPFTLLRAMFECLIIILRYRPVAIIGFGGYATFPIVVMGKLLRRPVLIHEQNSIAGYTNRSLAYFATAILTAFPGVLAGAKTRLVGNPVRAAIKQITAPINREIGTRNKLRIVVLGGSLGAKALNDNVPLALARISQHIESVVHQVGRGDAASVSELYQEYNISARVVNFIDDMASVYATADLVICRAGASTVAEITAVGLAAIFVPYPSAVDDHQTSNAHYLVAHQAAFLLPQHQLSVAQLADLVARLTPTKCQQMAIKARELALPDSTAQICQAIECLING